MRRKLLGLVGLLSLVVATQSSLPASASAGNTYFCAFSKTSLPELEGKLGRKFGMHRIYHKWDSVFPGKAEATDAAAGRVPFLTWKALRKSGPVSWKRIASGGEDSVIRARATGLKNFGKLVLLSFHHEPENDVTKNGSAADYAAAFRRVSTIFDSVGAANVKMVWGPIMAYTFQGGHGGPDRWYPGPSYIDYVGTNGYNWYPGRPYTKWRSFQDTFDEAYRWAASHGKPLAIGETGVMEDPKVPGRKAQWFKDALATMKSWPNLKAFCYFNSETSYNQHPWWVTSSASSLSAFKAIGQDPWMQA